MRVYIAHFGKSFAEFAQETRQDVTKPAKGSLHESHKSGFNSPGNEAGQLDRTIGFVNKIDDVQLVAERAISESLDLGSVETNPPNLVSSAGLEETKAHPQLDDESLRAMLVATVGQTNFDLWFGMGCEFVIRPTEVLVRTSNKFSLTRLQTTFGADLRQVVDRLSGPHVKVRFETAAEAGKNRVDEVKLVDGAKTSSDAASNQNSANQRSEELASSAAASSASVSSGLAVTAKSQRNFSQPSLSSFWFGPENRLAEASIQQLESGLGQFSPLLVYGPCGSGKSHLLSAVTQMVRRRLRGKRCVFLSAEQFTTLFLQSLRGTGLPMFRRKYRDLDLLAIDDVNFFAGKKATLNEFQYTIDNLMRAGKQIIVSSDRPPAELGDLGQDVATRLTAGMVAPLRFPGFEGRMQIAKRYCLDRNFSFPEPVLESVCRRVTSDVRQLSGAVNRLHLAEIATGKKVSASNADELLSDLFAETTSATSMQKIEKAVCELCGVRAVELKSESRKKKICTARMLAMYLSREHTSSALSEIGEFFGRSHSTVIAAQRKVSGWLTSDEQISLSHSAYRAKDVVQRIKNDLRIG